MEPAVLITVAISLLHLLIGVGLSLRVIMRRKPVGTSLAWLVIVFFAPLVGGTIYLILGEKRLGEKRAARMRRVRGVYRDWQADLREHAPAPTPLPGTAEMVRRQAASAVGFAAQRGNDLELLSSDEAFFSALIADIDRAQRTCHMEFYIWHEGGRADEVVEALCRAAERGVACRLLLDAIGSGRFLRGRGVQRLRAAGVDVSGAMKVHLFRTLFVRLDLRNHRKIVVIDGEIAYQGSQNLVDPRFFKQKHGFGRWIDVMVRMEGPAVEGLAGIFLADWEFDTGRGREVGVAGGDIRRLPEVGDVVVQVVPSGPGWSPKAAHELLLTTIYAARSELVVTTPYFVPDESIVTSLTSAAHRGVDVRIIVPAKVDSKLVGLASRGYFAELLEAGVRIAQFHGGLLHSKAITVDRRFCMVGSLNIDMRSLWLNYEISMLVYDESFTEEVRYLQNRYFAMAEPVVLDAWRARSVGVRFVENTVRLVAPLL